METKETCKLKQKKLIHWIGEDGEEHSIVCNTAYTAWQCNELMMWNNEMYPFDRMELHDGMIWEIHSGDETMCWVRHNARICIDHEGKYERWTVVKEV